jgi:hypothetical protein
LLSNDEYLQFHNNETRPSSRRYINLFFFLQQRLSPFIERSCPTRLKNGLRIHIYCKTCSTISTGSSPVLYDDIHSTLKRQLFRIASIIWSLLSCLRSRCRLVTRLKKLYGLRTQMIKMGHIISVINVLPNKENRLA